MGLPFRMSQNLCSPSCPIDHIIDPGAHITQPVGSWPDIRGLNSLNYSRDIWLAGDAIEVSIATYCSGLPKSLYDRIGLGTPGLHPKVWHQGPAGKDALFEAAARPPRRVVRRLKETEYSIFPLCTDGNHWVLVVIHKEERPSPEGDGGGGGGGGGTEWSHVAQIAVLDPYRQASRLRMVYQRLAFWLQRAGGFTISANFRRTVWLPLQKDDASCGPRAYWNAKQILDRLLELHEGGAPYDPSLWDDLSGWFNEPFVRAEMIGRCAAAAVRAMNYRARVSVECVDRVRRRDRRGAEWEDAGRVMAPPAADAHAEPESRPRPRPRPRQPLRTRADADMNADPETTTTPPPPRKSRPSPESSGATGRPPSARWRPPPPTPNQHRIAPGARPTANDPVKPAERDIQAPLKSPACPPTDPRSGTSFPPPKTLAPFRVSGSRSGSGSGSGRGAESPIRLPPPPPPRDPSPSPSPSPQRPKRSPAKRSGGSAGFVDLAAGSRKRRGSGDDPPAAKRTKVSDAGPSRSKS
ncbi:hypothetical protein SAMD00023353_2000320 [Rosellinia necatrix]|uniref:Ubiquitin-like protease family profile domain-containing protein n=1 Tax=Rosellinia necatrix TaxID=77044 RepID=A0A1W2TF72_ROSNE|nr:hypothetical protein SAMD00023353_2000320 [Rosellinia necatrix]